MYYYDSIANMKWVVFFLLFAVAYCQNDTCSFILTYDNPYLQIVDGDGTVPTIVLRLSVVVLADTDVPSSWVRSVVHSASTLYGNVDLHIQKFVRFHQSDPFSPTSTASEILNEVRLYRQVHYMDTHATIVFTSRAIDRFLGIAYLDSVGNPMFCDVHGNPSPFAVAVIKVEDTGAIETNRARIVTSHEIGHLFGLSHYDIGWPNQPQIMNTVYASGTQFSQESRDHLTRNIITLSATGCVARVPEVNIIVLKDSNGMTPYSDSTIVELHMDTLVEGYEGFSQSDECGQWLEVLTPYYARCHTNSSTILTIYNGYKVKSIELSFLSYPIFYSYKFNRLCNQLILHGIGLSSGNFLVFAGEPFPTPLFPTRTNTEAIVNIPATLEEGPILYVNSPGWWKPTGLYYHNSTCTPPEPFRCGEDLTCEENGLPGYCCSKAGWCGTTVNHCRKDNCLNGPCFNLPLWRCSDTVTCEMNGHPGYCCSAGNWCGKGDQYCGFGCKSGCQN